MFNFSSPIVHCQPFPIVIFRNFLSQPQYQQLVDGFPQIDKFELKEGLGQKYSMSRINSGLEYEKFLNASQPWKRFAEDVLSRETIINVVESVRTLGFDLGISTTESRVPLERMKTRVNHRLGALGRLTKNRLQIGTLPVTARFEFSALPASGGCLLPHTDAPQKLATFVLPMIAEGEWDPSWGGGTDLYKTRNVELSFNRQNRQLGFEDVEVVRTYEFLPNQALLFIRTDSSWHGVSPIRGPNNKFRRSITWNLECPKQLLYV